MVFDGDAVTSNGPDCAAIGMLVYSNHSFRGKQKKLKFELNSFYRDILQNHNGTAVDAMIATLFCEGVAVTQSCGK